jgi:ribosomal protein S18 acetylase RimI-like enzyme
MSLGLSLGFGRLWSELTKSLGRHEPSGSDGVSQATRPPVRIRPAVRRDYDQICELYEELDAFHRQARPDLFDRPSSPPRDKATIFGLIADSSSEILVAQDTMSERILGFAVLMIRDLPPSTVCYARRFVEIDKLAVRLEARGGGIGRALVTEAFAWAEDRKIRHLEVAVNDFNTGAIALYQSSGFDPVIRRMMWKRRGSS